MTSLSNARPRPRDRALVAPTATVEDGARVGPGAQVWDQTVVRSGAQVGDGTILGRGVYVGPGARIGERCKVQNQALVYEPAVLGDGVFIGPAVVLTNDTYPRAVTTDGRRKGAEDWEPVGVTIEEGASRRRARGLRRAGADRPVGQRRRRLRRHPRRARPRARRRLAREADRLGGPQRRTARLGQP